MPGHFSVQINTEVLLISSRRTGDLGIPKGHMESGETANEGAAREAFEEAGVRGTVTKDLVGARAVPRNGSRRSACG